LFDNIRAPSQTIYQKGSGIDLDDLNERLHGYLLETKNGTIYVRVSTTKSPSAPNFSNVNNEHDHLFEIEIDEMTPQKNIPPGIM
jgi:hypothetical protein